jgi:predicted ribosome quality control (RQC) complex YloA/Tae2 family protein
VSKGFRYDSLLVRALAEALDERWSGRRIASISLDESSWRVVIASRDRSLHLDLHPSRGYVWEGPAVAVAGGIRVGTRLTAVIAEPDERSIEFRHADGSVLVVELPEMGRNALLVRDGRIAAVLRPRRSGPRPLVRHEIYRRPRPRNRLWAEGPPTDEAWTALLGDAAPASRRGLYLGRVAYASPINATAVLGDAESIPDAAALAAACRRYRTLRESREAWLLQSPDGLQPYPAALGPFATRRAPDLLSALGPPAGTAAEGETGARVGPDLLRRLERRLAAAERRQAKLAEASAGAASEAVRLRGQADLILAHLAQVPRGASSVRLPGFEGSPVEIALDPSLPPSGNARRLYDEARKRDRAAARVPALLSAAEETRAALADLLTRARHGTAEAAEVEAALGGEQPDRPASPGAARALPYRRYRTSGGLEVRVGRNRQSNDDLTFHHSAPDDIWLHARDAAGSHVILRWQDAKAHPPAADLAEAALLAALHSRARSSGVVPVDWTRRKYVRKPRRAPPGKVMPDRVRTIFVEPAPEAERRLRW